MSESRLPLAIQLLGPPLVTRGEAPLALANQKALALLYYLAVGRQAPSRDHLTALLWGDAPLANARHSLRSTLYRLRQALQQLGAAQALVADGERVALDPRLVVCDMARYNALLAAGGEANLRAAVELVRGPFLEGFGLPDALLFDEFVQQQDAQLTRSRQRALAELAGLAEQREDWAQAVADLEALVRLDPLDEPAHQRLMALYVRSGSPGLAQRHLALVERTLDQELGLAPTEQTRAALRAAVEQRRAATGGPPPLPFVRPRPSTLPFVGRAATLAALQQTGAGVAAGSGRALVIEGDAGIGKSRLVDELLAALRRSPAGGRPWQILQGRCSPYDSILAYGPFREAFSGLLPDSLDGAGDPERGGEDRVARFAELILHALTTLARRGPVALAIDDLHLADSQSLTLFGYLAMHLRRLPLLLIGTAQGVDDAPALRELVALGRRRSDLEVHRLAALSCETVHAMLDDMGVGATASRSLAPWLLARSVGNPFVLEALIAQLQGERLLMPIPGGWQLDNARWMIWRAVTPLPESTFDLVSRRLDALGPLARQAVDLLAVAGDGLPAPLIVDLLGEEPPAAYGALEELLALRLADEQRELIALRHQLLCDAALSGLSGMARRAVHRRLAAGWERFGGQAGQIARHAVAGGDLERARRYGLQLLSDLPYAYAGGETVAFLQQLADLVEPTVVAEEAYRLAHALGQAHRSLGQLEQARRWHQRQLSLAQGAGLAEAEAVAHYELAEVACVHTDYRAAIEAARRGIALTAQVADPGRAGLEGRGRRILGAALAMEGSDLRAAEEQLRAAIGAHRQAGDNANLSAGLFDLGNVLAQQGHIRAALEHYGGASAALGAGEAPFLQALAENNTAYHSLLLGRPAEARAALARGRAIAEGHGLSSALLHLFSTECEIALYAGQWAEAATAGRHGLALAERLGNLERQAGYGAGLALAAAGRGEPQAARQQLEQALGMLAGGTYWHLRTRILLWLAELALDQQPADAGSYLETALTLARVQRRGLILLQAERLEARALARRDIAGAQAWLVKQLDQAVARDLSLEVARTRAALARVTLRHAPGSTAGRVHLERALSELHEHGAYAEAAALQALELQPA